MQKKYLLYIDILGFSELVKHNIGRVRRLYHIIDNLNAHRHNEFKTLVFSDTILIYNIHDPLRSNDHQYTVMYLIEFVQNLLNECAGKNYYFRAILSYGEFEHFSGNNVDRIFGKALVDAYTAEKSINCTGLFIDKTCQKYNVVFPIKIFSPYLSFVYMNQALDYFYNGHLGQWPIDGELMRNSDFQWQLAKDVQYLKDVYTLMNNHPVKRVREKMAATWMFYESRYEVLLTELKSKNFSLSVLSENFNWRPAQQRVKCGYKGFGVEPPTAEDFIALIEEARYKGSVAAKEALIQLYGDTDPENKRFAPCGGSSIYLDVDARSKIGRFILRESELIPHLSVRNWRGEGISINILDTHYRQERVVDEAASKVILEILCDKLGVDGYVHNYYD